MFPQPSRLYDFKIFFRKGITRNTQKVQNCPSKGILFLLRVLELEGTRSLATPVMRQPRSSPEPQASYRSTICKCKVRRRLWHWGFYRPSPQPDGRSDSNTVSYSFSAWTAGGHSLEKRKEQ